MVSVVANIVEALHNAVGWVLPSSLATVRTNKHNVPLPEVCHLELDGSVINNRSVFVIGDVHGCLDELLELMNEARTIDSNVLFVCVGDLVNKGPKSAEVLKHLQMLGDNVYSVRGNHDEGAIRQALKCREDRNYVLPDKYAWIKDTDDNDVQFLMELPYTISLPSLKSLIVHAGIMPGVALDQQQLNTLTNMRNIIRVHDSFWPTTMVGTNKTIQGEAWASVWWGPEVVYFGHDAKRKLQVHDFATGLDTGCCYGGHLTGVFINGCKRFLSVKSKQPRSHDYD